MTNKYKIALSLLFVAIFAILISVFFFKKEKVYTSNEYNSKGQLIGVSEYVIRNNDTILNGKFVRYNEKGIKISEGQFLNDEPYGKCFYYFNDGKIESIFYRKNSKVNLECTYYDKSGLINKYILCDDVGKTTFFIKFDEKVVKKYDGYALLPLNQCKLDNGKQKAFTLKDTLKVGDVIKYDYILANIPYAKRTFKIESEAIDNSKRTITKKAPTRIIVEEVLTKKGLNRIKAITRYTFNDKVTPVKNDTVSFDVNVR
ncbi:MAG: hypothetical protein ABI549_08960 [Flavobacterium sp.]|uniref:toxin-antitoxin system YwqK family antitoxin n=1 Tax=Flavobacterium sp. TaxID=239 RepID=UPI003265FFC4